MREDWLIAGLIIATVIVIALLIASYMGWVL